jgi:hypothetical protein
MCSNVRLPACPYKWRRQMAIDGKTGRFEAGGKCGIDGVLVRISGDQQNRFQPRPFTSQAPRSSFLQRGR